MIIPAPPMGLCTMKLRDDLANFVISGGVVRACDVMSRESTFLLLYQFPYWYLTLGSNQP